MSGEYVLFFYTRSSPFGRCIITIICVFFGFVIFVFYIEFLYCVNEEIKQHEHVIFFIN